MKRWMVALLAAMMAIASARVACAQGGVPGKGAGEPKAAEAEVVSCSSFRIEFSRAVLAKSYTGRVYVALSSRAREPRLDMGDWFGGPQVIAMDVVDAKAGEMVEVPGGASGKETLTFKAESFAKIAKGTYYAQAIARVDPDSPSPGKGLGDLCSEFVKVEFDPSGGGGVVNLSLSKQVGREAVKETATIKVVEIRSEKLSAFHGRDVVMRAGVLLPPDWKADSEKPYPVVYFITGFGGGHEFIKAMPSIIGRGKNEGVIFVVPDPLCFTGHSVFADSANNGPWGSALVTELIPAVEAKFHGGGSGANRFVSGISSGGWSSLWLQVAYPSDFGGCWSHCPDPVDFRDFQQIDVYAADANVYRDAKGERRPIARGPQGAAMLYYDDFVRQETVMGAGGQIGSFEAVFSPRGEDGKPRQLFDRATGAVDAVVAKAWEAYDIRLKMEREWATIGPKLQGKVHVYAGEKDSFYLEGAARLLKESLATMGSDAEVVIVPGMAHTVYRKGVQEMMEKVRGMVAATEAKK